MPKALVQDAECTTIVHKDDLVRTTQEVHSKATNTLVVNERYILGAKVPKQFCKFPCVADAVVTKATDDAVVNKGHLAVGYFVGVEHILTHSVGGYAKVEHHWLFS